MESIFDIFFEQKIQSLQRCGLKTRQNRTDVIDHLNAVISGYAEGELQMLMDTLSLFCVSSMRVSIYIYTRPECVAR